MKNKKEKKRLKIRQDDFDRAMKVSNPHGHTQNRKENGGFHKPGSNRKG